jgi:hypothetical protein
LSRKHRTDFNELLVDSVDEAITEVLGAKVTSAFWHHYQAFLGITREAVQHAFHPKLVHFEDCSATILRIAIQVAAL